MKKAPTATGLQKHVKTSHGLLIIGTVITLVALGVFYYVFQQNSENRSKAAGSSGMCSKVCKETLDPKTNMKRLSCSVMCPKATPVPTKALMLKTSRTIVTPTPRMILKSTGVRTTIPQTSGYILKSTSVRVNP